MRKSSEPRRETNRWAIPEAGRTRRDLSDILTAAMGREAIKEVNGKSIQVLTVVQNGRLVKDPITAVSHGHYKPVGDYAEPLESFDEATFETSQIETRVFQVYPFALAEDPSTVGQNAKARIEILTNRNYEQWMRLGLDGDNRLKGWLESQLDRTASKNSHVEDAIRDRINQWRRRQNSIKKNIEQIE